MSTDLLSLNGQLQQLTDRQLVADLITRLGRMLDEKRYDEAPTILAENVSVQTPGGSARGVAAVVEQARHNHTVRTQHVITDVLIQLNGHRAEAAANLIGTFAPDSDDPQARLVVGAVEQPDALLMVGERYRFEAVRGTDGWRLTTIDVKRLWSTHPIPTGARVAQLTQDAA